jgi:hypothetical protein
MHGYFEIRKDAETSGGGYAFKFGQLHADPPTDNRIYKHLWSYECKDGSPILKATSFQDGTNFIGCTVDDGVNKNGLNVYFRLYNYVETVLLIRI